MTEQEAKQRWCPMGRMYVEDNNGGGTSINEPDGLYKSKCIASDCMMWKSSVTRGQARAMNAASNAQAEPEGYCGLTK